MHPTEAAASHSSERSRFTGLAEPCLYPTPVTLGSTLHFFNLRYGQWWIDVVFKHRLSHLEEVLRQLIYKSFEIIAGDHDGVSI